MGFIQRAYSNSADKVSSAATQYVTSKVNNKIGSFQMQVGNQLNKLNVLGFEFGSILGDTIGEVLFGGKEDTSEYAKSLDKEGLGYSGDLYKKVPDAFKVRIVSSRHTDRRGVFALLQEPFSMKVDSEWKPFLNTAGLPAWTNLLSQAIFNVSLVNRYTSRRVWMGTTPISMMLRLKFEAVSDPVREVIEPCKRLQKMVLPFAPEGEFKGIFLGPPGPGGLALAGTFLEKRVNNINSLSERVKKKIKNPGDQITIYVGQLLKFRSVIFENCSVSFDKRFTREGYPIGAKVDIQFSTYEVFDDKKLEEAYSGARVGFPSMSMGRR